MAMERVWPASRSQWLAGCGVVVVVAMRGGVGECDVGCALTYMWCMMSAAAAYPADESVEECMTKSGRDMFPRPNCCTA